MQSLVCSPAIRKNWPAVEYSDPIDRTEHPVVSLLGPLQKERDMCDVRKPWKPVALLVVTCVVRIPV
jgi:hypothetical protein